MKSKEILFKLLYYALTKIRYHAHEGQTNAVFVVSNYLHNLPLKLLKAQTDADFDSILAEYEVDFQNNEGMKHLLNQVKEKVS